MLSSTTHFYVCPHCAHTRKPGWGPGSFLFDSIGRDGGIRTHDPLTPSQVRYQAALHPDLRAIPTIRPRAAGGRQCVVERHRNTTAIDPRERATTTDLSLR